MKHIDCIALWLVLIVSLIAGVLLGVAVGYKIDSGQSCFDLALRIDACVCIFSAIVAAICLVMDGFKISLLSGIATWLLIYLVSAISVDLQQLLGWLLSDFLYYSEMSCGATLIMAVILTRLVIVRWGNRIDYVITGKIVG